MKPKIKTILLAAMLCASFLTKAQQPIGFDLRGRDCNGGLGICSANKTSGPNNNISIQKIGENTFMLTILRASLSENEEASIAGHPFSSFESSLPNTFTQSGDLKFNDEVVQTLGIDTKYNLLKKGSYPMQIDGNVVKITLTLQEGNKS